MSKVSGIFGFSIFNCCYTEIVYILNFLLGSASFTTTTVESLTGVGAYIHLITAAVPISVNGISSLGLVAPSSPIQSNKLHPM
jgi:hypothetical protein